MFASRQDAGQKLARYLQQEGVQGDLIVGLPRGGVIVAAEVAHEMHLPLDVVVVRKIGHPLHREFALGALAENGVVVLDEPVINRNTLILTDLEDIIEEERARVQEYEMKFHREGAPDFKGKAVILVDDGLATGATTEAAVLAIKKQNPSRITVAVPVGSTHAIERLQQVADDVCVLWADADFEAVGRYYDTFTQTTDEEVLELLNTHTTSG
jgi:putative phosphoribosyl transferase